MLGYLIFTILAGGYGYCLYHYPEVRDFSYQFALFTWECTLLFINFVYQLVQQQFEIKEEKKKDDLKIEKIEKSITQKDVLSSFIESEKQYVDQLKLLDQFYLPLVVKKQSQIPDDETGDEEGQEEFQRALYDSIIGLCKVKPILEESQSLLLNLKKDFTDKQAAQVILKFTKNMLEKQEAFWITYVEHRSNFNNLAVEKEGIHILEELDGQAKIQRFQQVQLDQLIEVPITRLFSYKTVFEDIQKQTQIEEISQSIQLIDKKLEEKKETIDEARELHKIYKLRRKLDIKNLGGLSFGSDEEPRRSKFIMEGKLSHGSTRKEYDAYLFDDLFITSSMVMGKARNQIYHLTGDMRAMEVPDSMKIKNAFTLQIAEDESITFIAPTDTERKLWVKHLEKCLSVTFFELPKPVKKGEKTKAGAQPVQLQQVIDDEAMYQGDPPQDYYIEKLDQLRKKEKLWKAFDEPDSPENIELSEDGQIRCAKIPKLIQRLLHTSNDNYLFEFLLTYRSFITPIELLENIIIRYNTPPKKGITPEEWKKFKVKFLFPMRFRVLQVLKYWIENHKYDFRQAEGEILKKKIEAFIENDVKKTSKMSSIASQLSDTIKKLSKRDTFSLQKLYNIQKNIQQMVVSRASLLKKCPKPKLPYLLRKSPQKKSLMTTDSFLAQKAHNLDITEWSSVEIARQLTLIEFDIFEKIQPRECLKQAWNKENRQEKAPNIYAMIERTNRVVNWVSYEICKFEKLKDRQHALKKFIKVARECKKLNNLNALYEVIGGINSIAVHRLKKTWAGIPSKLLAEFKELEEFVSHKKNFKNLRTELNSVHPPCIPYIGLYLTDLTFIDEANPEILNNKINFYRCRKVARIIRGIMTFQKTPYNLAVVPELNNKLTNMNVVPEDTVIALSKKREPPTEE